MGSQTENRCLLSPLAIPAPLPPSQSSSDPCHHDSCTHRTHIHTQARQATICTHWLTCAKHLDTHMHTLACALECATASECPHTLYAHSHTHAQHNTHTHTHTHSHTHSHTHTHTLLHANKHMYTCAHAMFITYSLFIFVIHNARICTTCKQQVPRV